jgi:tetratricopeptide (TPR) repeat protein
VLKHLGKYDDALKSYNIAIDIDSNFADAYLNKAYLYFDLRKYEEALNAVEEYLKRREDTRGYILLARIYIKRNMKKEAKETLEKVLRIEPGNQDARELLDRLEGRGREERELKRLKEMLKEMQELLYEEIERLKRKYESLGRENSEIESLLKETRNLVDGGEIEKALRSFIELREKLHLLETRSLREMVEKDTMMLLELADMSAENINELSLKELEILREDAMKRILISKIERGEEKEGAEGMDIGEIQKLEREILKEVGVGGDYPGLAHILFEEGKWKELRKIKDEYAYNALGLKYLGERKYKRAMDYFVKALNKNPSFKAAEFNLAYTLLKRGEDRKARALLKHLGVAEYAEKIKKK